MTITLTQDASLLSVVHPEPPPRRGTPAPDGQALARRPAVPVVEIPRSADPGVVFACLADQLGMLGYSCLIEVITEQGGGCRIGRPVAAHEAALWGDLTMLLEAEPLVVCDGALVGVGFHGGEPTTGDDAPAGEGAAGADPQGGFTGALVASRPDAGHVTDADAQMVHGLVDHAVGVVLAERMRSQLEHQRTRLEHLEQALGTNREIGVAIGILMAGRRCNAEEAFALLRSASQNTNRKVRDIAAHLTYTGELPPPPPAKSASEPKPPPPA